MGLTFIASCIFAYAIYLITIQCKDEFWLYWAGDIPF